MDAILAQQGRERVLFTVDGAGTQELNPPSPPSFSLFDKIISKEYLYIYLYQYLYLHLCLY